jgi:hypothetical protein
VVDTIKETGEAAAEEMEVVLGWLVGDFAGTAGVVLTALGLRLGLWDALAGGPALAAHLRESVHTGTNCSYRPAHPVDWER